MLDPRVLFSLGERFGERDPGEIEAFNEMISCGEIVAADVTLPHLTTARRLVEERSSPRGRFSGRSQEHRDLCARSALWLESVGLGWTVSLPRLHYRGGVADVAALDHWTFVECGYTSARKVLTAVSYGCRVVVVPYGGLVDSQTDAAVGAVIELSPQVRAEFESDPRVREQLQKRPA